MPVGAGLYLNEEGLLVDEKTGEVINEYGATRFDVAVRCSTPSKADQFVILCSQDYALLKCGDSV